MRKIFSILIVCAVAVTASAIPARREGIVRTAADGTEKIVYLHGNENFHYMTDAEGNWLDEETLMPMSAEAKAKRMNAVKTNKVKRAPQQNNGIGDKPNIAPRGLLVMVNFSDVAFKTPKDTINNMLNGDNFTRNYSYSYQYGGRTYTVHSTSSGSVRRYFEAQSYGQYSPVFDVVGPVTLSKKMEYYGSNTSWGDDAHADEMIQEACKLADSQFGVDFTQYDNDNDGLVDFVYVIYAGYGEADGAPANTIWPHQWNLWDYGKISCIIDGKKLNRYACGSELSYLSQMYSGIGTICHEFSHVLGLPDLYYTASTGTSPHTLLDWDIMDYGPYNNDGNTPPAYSAYERFYMGWLTPRVLKDSESVWLNPINYENGESLLLCEGDQHNLVGYDPNPKTFYMLEYRTKTGWDAYLPGRGLLITKIQYNYSRWQNNTVNNSADNMGVDLIEARANNTTGKNAIAKSSDAFPAGAKYWYGFDNHEISEIKIEAGGAVSFSYRGAEKQPIENVEADKTVQKILRDGKVLIIRGGKTYNIIGAELR